MNASSQTPAGALPPESPHGQRLLPGPATAADTFAAYGAVFPVSLGRAAAVQRTGATVNPAVPHRLMARVPEPATPECFTCGGAGPWVPCPRGRVYPSGAQVLYCRACVPDSPTVVAAAGVIGTVMEKGGATAREVAQAEEQAGLLFDPERAKAISDAAYQLGVNDTRAELARMGQDGEILPWYHARRKAVALLCAGRPDDHLLTVREVLTAADGRTPTNAPLTLAWNRPAQVPDAHDAHKRVVVECTTAHGGRANLVLQDEERLALASLLDAETRDITTPCATSTACGTTDDLDPSDPMLFGWSRLQIAGIDGGPRWYCTPHCVSNALARAGDDLTIADDQAAVDGGL